MFEDLRPILHYRNYTDLVDVVTDLQMIAAKEMKLKVLIHEIISKIIIILTKKFSFEQINNAKQWNLAQDCDGQVLLQNLCYLEYNDYHCDYYEESNNFIICLTGCGCKKCDCLWSSMYECGCSKCRQCKNFSAKLIKSKLK